MTKEEKQLLLIDLCARLPYYTVLYSSVADRNRAILTTVVIYNLMNATDTLVIKPYLRPMSSMTEEEKEELYQKTGFHVDDCILGLSAFDWFNEYHFDYRDLIPMGLALEAPEDMYKNE